MNDQINPGYGATVLRAGDRVLITFHGDLTAQTAQQVCDSLEELFPGVVFALVDRVAAVVVQRSDP